MAPTLAYAAVMTGAAGSGLRAMRDGRWQPAAATVGLCLVLMVCLTAQIAEPRLLHSMQRDAGLIRIGEWYRLITALFFQDGWVLGGVWNITMLGLLGGLAEQMLRTWQWFAVYSVSAMSAELVALNWQPIGAGNSVGVFGLAAAVAVLARQPASDRAGAILALLSAAGGLLLALNHDKLSSRSIC